jgi:thiol:disulfide interchange protein DsbD
MNTLKISRSLKTALFVFLCGITFTTLASADEAPQSLNLFDDLGFGSEDEILSVDEAFQLTTETRTNSFIARWVIAEGHYLYRNKIEITVDDAEVKPGAIQLPAGESKDDPIFNKTLYVFHHNAEATLPFSHALTGDKETVFKVKYQGCSEISGICYPPETKKITVKLSPISEAHADSGTDSGTDSGNGSTTAPADSEPVVSEQDQLVKALNSGEIWITLSLFFGGGLLLAFTPCVLPMVPILSGIIIGQGENTSTKQALLLSIVYVLAMAFTYTIVGILVGLSGENIQAWFQNPWVIGFFTSIIVALSFSMFDFYELQMPASIQNKLTNMSNSQQGGTLIGVAIMGLLSALIVGPCVTAPLVGALIYIAETGDAMLGGLALFSLSMGMGAPLLVIGASAGKILPKAGAWMTSVKSVFGVLLLGLAIWLLERVAPTAVTMALWASLLVVSAIYMGAIESLPEGCTGWKKLWKGLGIVILVYGIVIFIGLSSGNRNIFQPLKGLSMSSQGSSQGNPASTAHLSFRQIKGVAGLNAALADAKAQGKPVMLDFYADWCVSCKEMEVLTFSDPAVLQALEGVMVLQADVTPNDELDRALYKHFGIIGPPSIMFFDQDGKELRNYRVVGYKKAEQFSKHINRALK